MDFRRISSTWRGRSGAVSGSRAVACLVWLVAAGLADALPVRGDDSPAAAEPVPAGPAQAEAGAPDPSEDKAGAGAVRPETLRTVDSLLDDAVSDRPAEEPAPGEPAAGRPDEAAQLPRTPSAEALMAVVNVLIPAVRGCAPDGSGRADLSLLLRPDGRVASATVLGAPFANTPGGRCMEGVLRRARFPAFRAARFRVQIPFLLQ